MLISQREALRSAYEKHTTDIDRPAGLYGVDTGHHDLNLVINGWVPGKVTTIAGKSKHGKSALVIQMLKAGNQPNLKTRGYFIFFSWEQSTLDNIERYVCHEVGITLNQYRYPKILPQVTRDAILKAYSSAKDFNVKYHQTSTDIDEVLRLVQEEIKVMKGLEIEQGISLQPIVVVDYVSMARSVKGRYGSKTDDIGHFLQTFKQYANKNGVTGVFLAQIRRDAEGEPNLSHVMDSANYENNSDNCVVLYRPEADMVREIRDPITDQMVDSHNRFMFRVLKARDGQVQDILGHCDIKYFRFWHRHHRYGFDYNSLYGSEEFWAQQYGV